MDLLWEMRWLCWIPLFLYLWLPAVSLQTLNMLIKVITSLCLMDTKSLWFCFNFSSTFFFCMQNQAVQRLKDERDAAVQQTQQLQQELVFVLSVFPLINWFPLVVWWWSWWSYYLRFFLRGSTCVNVHSSYLPRCLTDMITAKSQLKNCVIFLFKWGPFFFFFSKSMCKIIGTCGSNMNVKAKIKAGWDVSFGDLWDLQRYKWRRDDYRSLWVIKLEKYKTFYCLKNNNFV